MRFFWGFFLGGGGDGTRAAAPFNTRGRAQYYAQVHERARIRGRARGQGRRKILRRCGGRGKAGVYTVYIPYIHLTALPISTLTSPLTSSIPPIPFPHVAHVAHI